MKFEVKYAQVGTLGPKMTMEIQAANWDIAHKIAKENIPEGYELKKLEELDPEYHPTPCDCQACLHSDY